MPKIDLSLCEIMEYIGDRSRPLKEGEAVFKAGHIIMCGLDASNSEEIKSLCLQTSSLTSQPHEIVIMLNNDINKWKCVCSCKAGMSGFCKHIVATLIYINRLVHCYITLVIYLLSLLGINCNFFVAEMRSWM